jgi:hypothetical protein
MSRLVCSFVRNEPAFFILWFIECQFYLLLIYTALLALQAPNEVLWSFWVDSLGAFTQKELYYITYLCLNSPKPLN